MEQALPDNISKTREPIRWLLIGLLLGLLGAACYVIFRPFIGPVSWAAIVVLGAWPLHKRVSERLPRWPGLSATLSSVLMIVVVIGGLIPVLRGLGPELKSAVSSVTSYVNSNQEHLLERASAIPMVGEFLARELSSLEQSTRELGPLLQEYSQTLLGTASVAAQGLARLFFEAVTFLVAVFFLFYYGETLSKQLRQALLRVDNETEKLIILVEKTVIGVLYGIVFTAIAQGLLAGIGFAVAGAQAPILLGLTTMFFAVIPFGPQLVYLPVSASFLLNGHPVRGVLLALWGLLIVSSADNVLKPYFIARQAKLPLPLVLIGATGGVLGFGVIGVFVGPVAIGLMRSLWLGWVSPEAVFEEADEPEVSPTERKAEPEEQPPAEPEAKEESGEPQAFNDSDASLPQT